MAADIVTGPLAFEVYAAIVALNWSSLREMRRSPLQYRYRLEHPQNTDAMRLGRATHTAVFEPDRFALDYAVWRGGRRAGKKWKAFRDGNEGVTVLTLDQYERACRIRDAVRAHPVAARYLLQGQAERSIVWERDGRRMKARIDWVTGDAILDLKTARSIDTRVFASAVYRYGYHGQMAFYRSGWKALTGEELPCILVAVESEPPHDVAVYKLDEDALYAGDEEVKQLLAQLDACEAESKWDGRYPEEVELALPAWAWPDDEDMGDGGGVKWLMNDTEEG